MIKVYGYYSCGGYKDMYLGECEKDSSYIFYLPLLPMMKKKNNPSDYDQIKKLETLPQIGLVTNNDSQGFPSECGKMFSHGAYKAMYRTLSDGRVCLAIRGIENSFKDEEERDTPFNLMFIGDNANDISLLDSFAISYPSNYSEYNERLGRLFSYDPYVNGIKFALKETYMMINGSQCDVALNHVPSRISLLVLYSKDGINLAIKEQDLSPHLIDCVMTINGNIVAGKLNQFKKDENLPDKKEAIAKDVSSSDRKITEEEENRKKATERIKEKEPSDDYILKKVTEIFDVVTIGRKEIISEIQKLQNKIDRIELSPKQNPTKDTSIRTLLKDKTFELCLVGCFLIGFALATLIFK